MVKAARTMPVDIAEKLDVAYRSGHAQVSDEQFDQLENRLKEIDPRFCI